MLETQIGKQIMIVLDESMAINHTQSHRVLFFLLSNATIPSIQQISSSSFPQTLIDKTPLPPQPPPRPLSPPERLFPESLPSSLKIFMLSDRSQIPSFPRPSHQDPNVNAIDRAGEMMNNV